MFIGYAMEETVPAQFILLGLRHFYYVVLIVVWLHLPLEHRSKQDREGEECGRQQLQDLRVL